MMKNLHILFLILFLQNLSAQSVLIADVIEENKITAFSEQKLILIDFWATWCAPCVTATEQLEILQKQNKEKIFIISMSDEHSSKIKKYLEKKPIDLMVTSDYDKYTFSKYEIISRPYAVLLDLNGKLLWKGHPADLTQRKLDQYYDKQPNKTKEEDLFSIIEIKAEDAYVKEKLSDENAIIFEKIDDGFDGITIVNDEVNYFGSLSNLYFVLSNKYPFELQFDAKADERLKLTCSKEMWDIKKQTIIDIVLTTYNLQKTEFTKKINATELIIKNNDLLWDSNQFDWEGSSSNYIVGTDRIQADNMSLFTLCSLLSKIKDINYIYNGTNNTLYDWDIQFLYDNLMSEELESSFGITLKSTTYEAKIIQVSKK
ncbi:TlpA disulfide reductase family protein [uncultured Flavobacterium sp.]|uniref:TlpA family protein disulfide reductase n=1 Tax=uncultured Flavobacterium sp. TaxID=165435 RepID=UPI0030ECDC8F